MAKRGEDVRTKTPPTPEQGLRPVVVDTGPLNYLIRLGCVDILQDLHGRVLVPHAVLAELSHPGAPGEVRAWTTAPPPWVEFISVGHIDLTLPAHLGPGEREAISLAGILLDGLLILDDQRARAAALQRHIDTTGTLALVRLASMRGPLSFPRTILQLVEYGFRISPRLQSEILARFEMESEEKSR
ncbi:MAG TPA: hypothetical protein VHX60_19205 [Acidobacteriaceae bacterium]|jgi:predicted nucleic acid-binding protein|nr:hypothetical protein [Acidobacteriaceae bacterium]